MDRYAVYIEVVWKPAGHL